MSRAEDIQREPQYQRIRELQAARAENERLRQEVTMWKAIAARWTCCKAGFVAAPDRCPWHGYASRYADDLRTTEGTP